MGVVKLPRSAYKSEVVDYLRNVLTQEYKVEIENKGVKVPKNIYSWFLCMKNCSTTFIVESVLRIYDHIEEYTHDKLAMEVLDWADNQDDIVDTIYRMKYNGVEIEDEQI